MLTKFMIVALLGLSANVASAGRRDTGELVERLLERDEARRAEMSSIMRQIEELEVEETNHRRLSKKKSSRENTVCYGNSTNITALVEAATDTTGFNPFPGLDSTEFAALTVEIGVIDLSKDEGLMVEVSASSMIVDGGVTVENAGPTDDTIETVTQGYIGVMPMLMANCEIPKNAKKDEEMMKPNCTGADVEVVMPAPAESLRLHSYTTFQTHRVGTDGVSPTVDSNEFLLLSTTNTAKFYFPSSSLSEVDGDLVLDFVFQLSAEAFATIGASAVSVELGSYLIEVTKVQGIDEECDFDFIPLTAAPPGMTTGAALGGGIQLGTGGDSSGVLGGLGFNGLGGLGGSLNFDGDGFGVVETEEPRMSWYN